VPQNQPDFESLIRALNAEGVRYVVIGGLAMILQGSDYATVDSDFAVSTDPSNTQPIVRALASLRPHPHYATVDNFIWDERSIFGSAISMVTDAGDVDLLRVLPGVDSFDGLFERANIMTIFGETVRVASLNDLIAMKREANRPKDRNHVIELEALARVRSNNPSAAE
jgi:predicted nucleotidyltransferase